MSIPKLQITPVNVGAGPDDGTGDKLRDAVEKLNSNDASLEEVLAAILDGADPELTTFAQIAQVIYAFNAVVQALPVPATIQAQVTAAINAALAQLPTPASYTAQITAAIQAALDSLNANNLVKKNGDQLTGALDYAATGSVASAATTDLSNVASNNIEVTGTATVTSFGVRPGGAIRLVRFRDAGLVLTHNAANLILPGAANITTQAGDCAIIRSHGSGAWRCLFYQRADGSALASVGDIATIRANAADVPFLAQNVRELQLNAWADRQNIANGVVDPLGDASDLNGSVSAAYTLTNGVATPNATNNVQSSSYAISSGDGTNKDSSSDPTPTKQAAFDGSAASYWTSPNTDASVVGNWIGQDFGAGQTRQVTSIAIAQGKTYTQPYYRVASIYVDYSDDMSNWTATGPYSVATNSGNAQTITLASNLGAHRAWRLRAAAATNGGSSGGYNWMVQEITMTAPATSNMVLQSVAFPLSLSSPAVGRMAVQIPSGVAAFTMNTDFVASVSRDGGTTFTPVPLALAITQADGSTIYDGAVSIAGQPAGSSLVWKLTTPVAKNISVTGVVAEMRAS